MAALALTLPASRGPVISLAVLLMRDVTPAPQATVPLLPSTPPGGCRGDCARGRRACSCGRSAPAPAYDEPDELPEIALRDLDRLEADVTAFKRLTIGVYGLVALVILAAVLS